MKVQKMFTIDEDVAKDLQALPNMSQYVNDLLKKNLGMDNMTEEELVAELEAIKIHKAAEKKIKELRDNAKRR